MGHPAPFHLTMIGVGNEQWGQPYVERYKLFAAALKAKYPEIKLSRRAGPAPSGEQFDFLWSNWRQLNADIVDEHYYMNPEWFLTNTGRYDHYDRSGPKVFAGEYAAQTSGVARPDNRNNWNAAIAEAAFMTGLERNADVVQHGIVCAAARSRRRVAVDSRRDLVRQPALLRHAELLRAGNISPAT